jgi:nitrous oxidase accessory protein NosD
MVSGMALMLSAIIGVKKLASSGGDDHGHQVHYVSAHDHHRRRRSVEDNLDQSPYSGWLEYMTSN